MFWQKVATERYKRGDFSNYVAATSTQLTSTEAPDGSIMLMHQGWLRRNGVESSTPPLESGWNNLGTTSGGPINWDGQNWYYTTRLSWAVASSTTRATNPNYTYSDPLYRTWIKGVIRSDNGEALTATVKTIGNDVNLSGAKAPATLIRVHGTCCHEYPANTVDSTVSNFYVDGESTGGFERYGYFLGNGDPNWMTWVGIGVRSVDTEWLTGPQDLFAQGIVTTSQDSAISQERENSRTALLIEAS